MPKKKKRKSSSNQGLRSLLTYIAAILLVLVVGGYYSYRSLVATNRIYEVDLADSTGDLPIPSLHKLTDPTCTNISLRWDPIEDSPGYQLEIADNPDFATIQTTASKSADQTSYTFAGLKENTQYFVRIALTSTSHYSPILEVRTKDCSNTAPQDINSTPAPTATPTPTPIPTPSPINDQQSKISISSPSLSPSPSTINDQPSTISTPSPKGIFSGTLNDVFGVKPEDVKDNNVSEPSFFRKIILGWQAIFQSVFSL